jgi:CRP/FNR family transcriptional regulator, cyclic AMP receptor protein
MANQNTTTALMTAIRLSTTPRTIVMPEVFPIVAATTHPTFPLTLWPVRLRKDAKVSLLERVPLFQRCSKRDLGRIGSLAREVEYAAGTPVVREGGPGSEFFVIVEGEVDVRSRARKLATLRAGNYFGEIALITGSPRTASVTTGTPVRALVIEGRDFRNLLRDSPEIQFKVLQEVAKRLEERSSLQAPRRIRLRD